MGRDIEVNKRSGNRRVNTLNFVKVSSLMCVKHFTLTVESPDTVRFHDLTYRISLQTLGTPQGVLWHAGSRTDAFSHISPKIQI
jgi:hypothetical protein